VADALEAPREDMQQEAPEKFDRVKCHTALAMPMLIILPAEGHLAIRTGEEPPLGDGDAMRVAGEVA
jgi:hypothetical protein